MSTNHVVIACDHGGLSLKQKIIQTFSQIEWQDLGTSNEESVDYPDFANHLAEVLKSHPDRIGILVCGSGQGMAMRANKFAHLRAALCWNEESARLSREHNDANVLCLGGRLLDHDLALKMTKVFFETPFEGGRHARRVEKLNGKAD
jgi:ribose 5-phosphate isomerase B